MILLNYLLVSDAADFESYTFQKVDHTNFEIKSSFEDYLVSLLLLLLFIFSFGVDIKLKCIYY